MEKEEIKPVKNTVEIDKTQLDDLLNRIKTLEGVTSKTRMREFEEERKRDKNATYVGVRSIDGKFITSWKSLRDIVEKNPQGEWEEDQVVEIIYEDGTKQEMPLIQFERRWKKNLCKVLSTKVDEITNVKTFEVLDEISNKKYQMEEQFIN